MGFPCRHSIPFARSVAEKPLPGSVLAFDLPLQHSALMFSWTWPLACVNVLQDVLRYTQQLNIPRRVAHSHRCTACMLRGAGRT